MNAIAGAPYAQALSRSCVGGSMRYQGEEIKTVFG